MNNENIRGIPLSPREKTGVRARLNRIPWFETILMIVVMAMSLYAAFSDAQNLSLR